MMVVVIWCELGAERPELTFTFLCATFTVARYRTVARDVRSDNPIDDLPQRSHLAILRNLRAENEMGAIILGEDPTSNTCP